MIKPNFSAPLICCKCFCVDYGNVIIADEPPVADAGKDVYIQLPVDTAKLNGDASTDDKAVVQYMWTLKSGAQSVQYDWADTAYLSVYGLEAGEYVFMLTVQDEAGQSDDDEVTIYVEGIYESRETV